MTNDHKRDRVTVGLQILATAQFWQPSVASSCFGCQYVIIFNLHSVDLPPASLASPRLDWQPLA